MNDFIAQQGWQCPLCKRVYSPFTPCCLYCGAEGMAKTSTDINSTSYIDWQKQQSITTAKCMPQEDITKTGTDWVKSENPTGTVTLDIGGYTITSPLKGKEE